MAEVQETKETKGKLYYINIITTQKITHITTEYKCKVTIQYFIFRKFEIWHRLGTVEIDDQIAVTEYLIRNLPIIDPKRV